MRGGGRFIVDWLEEMLRRHGHDVERFYLPFSDHPTHIFEQFVAYRLMDLTGSADRLIAIRPPAYAIRHPNKVLWFIHHLRVYYDMWDSEYRPLPEGPASDAFRDRLHALDNQLLREARKVFTNSRVVGDRLRQFNQLESEVLYPPILDPGRFSCAGYGDEIACICRMEPHKRQHLAIEAMRHVSSGVRLRLCGLSSNPAYVESLREMIRKWGLGDRMRIDERWISEEEKSAILSQALAVVYLPHDEDSYGYSTLEAAHASKLTVTTSDSGGVPEFVQHGRNGFVCEPDPRALAEAYDQCFVDRQTTSRMGQAASRRIGELNITWDHVVSRLLA